MASLSNLKIVPLPAPLAANLDAAQVVTKTVEAANDNHYPCRRCLTNGRAGEELLLLSYDPFLGTNTSPYRQHGPIFVHKHDCARYQGCDVPDQQRPHQLALRAFDRHHMMQETRLVPGTELESHAEQVLENQDVDYIHVHYAGPGCFALRLERGGE